MNAAILTREFHILTTVGGMPADEAIEFINEAARAAKGVGHQSSENANVIPEAPGGTGRKGCRPVSSLA